MRNDTSACTDSTGAKATVALGVLSRCPGPRSRRSPRRSRQLIEVGDGLSLIALTREGDVEIIPAVRQSTLIRRLSKQPSRGTGEDRGSKGRGTNTTINFTAEKSQIRFSLRFPLSKALNLAGAQLSQCMLRYNLINNAWNRNKKTLIWSSTFGHADSAGSVD